MQMSKGTRLSAIALTVGMLAAGVATAGTAVATPAQSGCDNRNNNTYAKILECVRLEGVREHQAAFQAIADANGGNRSAGTEGYTDSAQYVIDTMTAAGWNVTTHEFPFTYIPPAFAGAAGSGERHVRDRGVHRFGHRQHHRQRDPGRHQSRATAGEHERLRGGGLRRWTSADHPTLPSSSGGRAHSGSRRPTLKRLVPKR